MEIILKVKDKYVEAFMALVKKLDYVEIYEAELESEE